VTWHLFNSNSFATSAALVEVCALLSAILVLFSVLCLLWLASIITLHAKLSGTVYCTRFCLWVCLCVSLLPR